jgi:tight adherence protein B
MSTSSVRRLAVVTGAPPAQTMRPDRLAIASAVALGCGAGALIWGITGAVTIALAVGTTAVAVRRARSLREHAVLRTAVVDFCRAVASELRAGRPPGVAVSAAAGGVAPALAALLQQAAVVGLRGDNDDLADALGAAGLAGHAGAEGLRRVAACWRVAALSGAALAPAIDRVADALQDEIEVARDVDAVLAGPRATVRLLAGLPVLGVLLGSAIGARPIAFLLGSVPGAGCLVAAIALDAVGLAWARQIARRAAVLG